MFFDSFIDELEKIALDISMDPKKIILQKQFEDINKDVMKSMAKGAPPPPEEKQPSVVYHVKVRPGQDVSGKVTGPVGG